MLVIGLIIASAIFFIILEYFFAVNAVIYYFVITGLVLVTVAVFAVPWRKHKERSKSQNTLKNILPNLFLSMLFGEFIAVIILKYYL